MATAKKLKSGSWRCLVFSHKELVYGKDGKPILDKDGKPKVKRVYESFTSDDPSGRGKREAEYLAAQFASKKERREQTVRYTVSEALDEYISCKQNILSPTTLRGYRTLQRNSYSEIASTQLGKLSKAQLQKWVNQISIAHSPKYVRNAYGLLTAVLAEYAPDVRFRITLPMAVQPELYTPSDADICKLLKSIQGTELELAVLLAAFGTMRRGEVCALTSEDIRGNTVCINKSLVRDGGKLIVKSPKTTSSFREVELPDFVIQKISNIDGRIVKMHPEDVTKKFGQAVERSGLPHFRFHDLRHYSASIMHAIGVPDQYIMDRGGWKSDRVLKATYRNVINQEKEKFTKKINGHFEAMQHEMQHEIKKVP